MFYVSLRIRDKCSHVFPMCHNSSHLVCIVLVFWFSLPGIFYCTGSVQMVELTMFTLAYLVCHGRLVLMEMEERPNLSRIQGSPGLYSAPGLDVLGCWSPFMCFLLTLWSLLILWHSIIYWWYLCASSYKFQWLQFLKSVIVSTMFRLDLFSSIWPFGKMDWTALVRLELLATSFCMYTELYILLI